MANEIMPEEMEAMQAQSGKPAEPVTKIAQDVGSGLQKLSELLDGSQGATDEDRAAMASIITQFVDLVEKKLGGSAPGEDMPSEEPMPNQVPVAQGMNGAPMGPNTRN